MKARFEMIVGCMFSGKSTELLRRIRLQKTMNKNIFVVKYANDKRYGDDKYIWTHSGDNEAVEVDVLNLMPLLESETIQKAECILIDEAQFFNDLKPFILNLLEREKYICIAGLDFDFNAMPFMNIINVMPFADEIIRLSSMCALCKDGTHAHLTKNKSQCTDRVQIGGSELYMPVCRHHFIYTDKI
jgi:thymidine kinase